jgi:hypothetical protein
MAEPLRCEYHGPARPIFYGGYVDYSIEPEYISGEFCEDDFQDGSLRLYKPTGGKSWLLPRRLMRNRKAIR